MLLSLVLAQAIALGNPEGPIFSQPSLMNRLAQFEAYNLVSTDWCSTAAGTGNGARGEALTFARASAATCTKGVNGLRSTLIADGDLQSLSANQVRMMADSDGYVGPLIEGAASPITIQSRPICNAAWADVGTPDCQADLATGPWGTQTMANITDSEVGSKEGRSQTMATTSASRFTAYCYVKGSAALNATITLAGTGDAAGDCTGTNAVELSEATSSIVSCTSAVAYTGAVTAVTVSILVGADVAETGDIYVEGCNVVPSAVYRTSFTDAAAVTVARSVDLAKLALPALAIGSASSLSAYIDIPGATSDTGWFALEGSTTYAAVGFGAGVTRFTATALLAAQAGVTSGLTKRSVGGEGATSFACAGGTCTTGGAITSTGTPTFLWVGDYNVGFPGTRTAPGIYTRLCWQSDSATRCR